MVKGYILGVLRLLLIPASRDSESLRMTQLGKDA